MHKTATVTRARTEWHVTLLKSLIICWMAVYPIYTSYYKANAIEHYERHKAHVQGNSMFFNPWQYRILSPILIEGLYWTADKTIFRLFEIKGIDLVLPGNQGEKNEVTRKMMVYLKNPEFIKYTLIFLAFRFGLNLAVLLLCFRYFSHFLTNKLVIYLGLMTVTLFMGNSVVDSDLTFNTYLEIALFLLAGIVIVRDLNPLWILLLTLIGVLNRETAFFIPFLYFFNAFNWKQWPSIGNLVADNKKVVLITLSCAVVFLATFFAIRNYYGFQPVSTWRVGPGLPMLKLNLFSSVSVKTYMELFGVFGFLPLWALFILRRMNPTLRRMFIILVPVWFVLHFTSAIAYQTRLFLVPTLLVLVPAILFEIEQSYRNKVASEY